MLEGITVLSQTELYDAPVAWVMIPAIVVLFGCLFICVLFEADESLSGLLSFFAAFLVAIAMYNVTKYTTGEYKYECVIEDSVSMTEFCERYEIVDQRGKIYIIKEKDND